METWISNTKPTYQHPQIVFENQGKKVVKEVEQVKERRNESK